jgi:O-antigen/teichoic acid export membrane protein
VVLLVNILPNTYLVRRYKESGSDEERLRLIETSTSLRVTLSLAAMMTCAIVGCCLSISPEWRLSVVMGIPLIGVNVCDAGWLVQAQEAQPAQYRTNFWNALIVALSSAVFLHPGSGTGSDLVLALVAGGVGLIILWRYAGFLCFWKLIQWNRLRNLGADVQGGLWLYLTGIVVYIYVGFQVPLVGYLVSVQELGLYRVAISLCTGFNSFLVMIPTLLYPRFIVWKTESPEKLWIFQKRIAWMVSGIGIFVVGAAFIFSPTVFPIAYGAVFGPAAIPFALLMTAKVIAVLNGVFAWGLWSLGRDRTMFVIMMGGALVSVLLNIMFIPRYGMNAAAIVNIISECLILGGTLFLSSRINRRKLR